MEKEKLEHYRRILQAELQRHTENANEDQAMGMDGSDDGVKDNVDMSLSDVNKELAFRLGERETEMISEIEEALDRIDDGTYGQCLNCGNPINERRLEAVPTARYDAACQQEMEKLDGEEDTPTL